MTSPLVPRRAFTLPELLTVIAIIGILAAILIPVVARVRGSSRQSVCISHLRQIGIGFRLFAIDNKDHLPPMSENGTSWTANEWYPQLLKAYISTPEVWNCPGQPVERHYTTAVSGSTWKARNEWLIPCYAINGNLTGTKTAANPNPGKKLADCLYLTTNGQNQILLLDGRATFFDQASVDNTTSPSVETPHDDRTGVLFIDGRATTTARADIIVYNNPDRTWNTNTHLPQRIVTLKTSRQQP